MSIRISKALRRPFLLRQIYICLTLLNKFTGAGKTLFTQVQCWKCCLAVFPGRNGCAGYLASLCLQTYCSDWHTGPRADRVLRPESFLLHHLFHCSSKKKVKSNGLRSSFAPLCPESILKNYVPAYIFLKLTYKFLTRKFK